MRITLLAIALAALSLSQVTSAQVPQREARFTPDPLESQSYLGAAVAFDGETAVALRYTDESPPGGDGGGRAVSVYSQDGSGWARDTSVLLPTCTSLFTPGLDVDGSTFMVGIDREICAGGGGSDRGAAYVYERQGGSWLLSQTLTPDAPVDGARFGSALALDGDRAVVGAFGENTSRGAVYVFERVGGAWVQQVRLDAADGEEDDQFGLRVDLDGDRILVGAAGDDDRGENAGAAYVFEIQNGAWTQTAKLRPAAGSPQFFGLSVSLRGDRALVGSAEAVDEFEMDGGAWSRVATVVGEAGTFRFGRSIDLGENRLAVSDATSFYVFGRTSSGWTQESRVSLPNTGASGPSVAVSLAGERVVAGALDEDVVDASGTTFTRAGGVYIYNLGVFVDAADAPDLGGLALSSPAPNPARAQTTVRLSTDAPGRATATVYDALGRRVAVVFEGEIATGTDLTVPTDRLAPGVYSLRVTTATGTVTRRFSVVR